MSRTALLVPLLVLAASQIALAEPPKEFKLTVGKNSYEVAEGQPIKIVTPKGETVEVVLTRAEILRFAEHGVAFDYDRRMKVSASADPGVATITAETTDSPLCMIQVYTVDTTPEDVRRELINSFRKEFGDRKASFIEGSGRKVKRLVNKVEVEGQILDFLLAGERNTTEVYSYKKGKAVIGLVLQRAETDAEQAQKLFDVITASLQ